MLPIRHVLCATDLNGNSRRAFETATTVAKAAAATLVILHVSRAPVFPPGARLDAPTMEGCGNVCVRGTSGSVRSGRRKPGGAA